MANGLAASSPGMDPAVTAALITTPAAILAAAAAYAARSAQGRGSVDAVRRQQQLEVYAAFLTAARRHRADIEEALTHAAEIRLARAAGEPFMTNVVGLRAPYTGSRSTPKRT